MSAAVFRTLYDLFKGWVLLGFVAWGMVRWPALMATLLMVLGLGLVAAFCWRVARGWR